MFEEQIYREDTASFMQFLYMETLFNPPPETAGNICNALADFKIRVQAIIIVCVRGEGISNAWV